MHGARVNNLKDVSLEIGKRLLTVFTGVSGSGKSSLVFDTIVAESQRLINETYSAFVQGFMPTLGAKVRSTVGTAADANAIMRILFSRLGQPHIGEESEGRQFQAEVLEHKLGSRNINEVLEMSVSEAEQFFAEGEPRGVSAAHAILERMSAVGLGYLTIGQPLTTLSGGECQRLKLAIQMAEEGGTYLLDEPTNGLHLADVDHLLKLLDRLVESGKSVIVIAHHQAVVAHADWIIDLGPGAGHEGGGWCLKEPPPNWSMPARPLPASTSPNTSDSPSPQPV